MDAIDEFLYRQACLDTGAQLWPCADRGHSGPRKFVSDEQPPYTMTGMSMSAAERICDAQGRPANVYDLSIYDGLPKVGEANQELQKVALSCGLRTLRTSWKDFTAWDSRGRRICFGLSFSEESSPVSGFITGNKQLTRQFLETAEAPVPKGRTFRLDELDAAVAYASDLGYPVVAKPRSGKSGSGVVANISDEQGVRWAVQHISTLQNGRGRFIIEQHLQGQDYRIYVAYGEVLSVVLRQPASVTGDGASTVAELVEAKNNLRRHNPHTRTRLIRRDGASTYQLQKQGLDWESTPGAGHHVALASAANISQGGDSTEVLPETHPEILDAAVRAVEAIPGLNQAGVDFLLVDHGQPLSQQGGGICEINTTPALMANQAPAFGEVQPVAQKLVSAAAKKAGVHIEKPQEKIAITLRAQGVADPQRLAAWTTTHAQRLELGGRIRAVGSDYLRVLLAGPAARVSALVTSMHTGNLRDRPDWVKTAPTERDTPARFQERTA